MNMDWREFFSNNNWLGKLIGALLGHAVAGPVGALFGILIGNFFDKGLAEHFSNPHLLYHAEKRQVVQKIFFQATFSVMGHIAKADGRVSEEEIEIARVLMDEMRLSREQKELAKNLYNEGKREQFNLDAILNLLLKVCGENRHLLQLFLDIQYRAAQIDGLPTKKFNLLNSIFIKLRFAPLGRQHRFYEDFGSTSSSYQSPEEEDHSSHQQKQQHHYRQQKKEQQQQYYQKTPQNTLAHAYALIDVSPSATKQEVKRAYRRLLSKNHPDKLIAQGLPEQMIKLANDKTFKIRKAYELICQTKGWS